MGRPGIARNRLQGAGERFVVQLYGRPLDLPPAAWNIIIESAWLPTRRVTEIVHGVGRAPCGILTKSVTARMKVLDFGLAKAVEETTAAADPANSSTMSIAAT